MIVSETRERFLKAILAQVPVEQIAEIHFFQPIKQGGAESGVAVIAAVAPPPPAAEAEMPSEPTADEPTSEAPTSEAPTSEAPTSEESTPEPMSEPAPEPTREPRHVIYTARYRLTLKGIDRGKWETNVVADADAPLIAVDTVVRGVQRRAGDVEDPVRLTGDELRALAAQSGMSGHIANPAA